MMRKYNKELEKDIIRFHEQGRTLLLAHVVKIERKTIYVSCPICGDIHLHGLTADDPTREYLGTATPDCFYIFDKNMEYAIINPRDKTKSVFTFIQMMNLNMKLR